MHLTTSEYGFDMAAIEPSVSVMYNNSRAAQSCASTISARQCVFFFRHWSDLDLGISQSEFLFYIFYRQIHV